MWIYVFPHTGTSNAEWSHCPLTQAKNGIFVSPCDWFARNSFCSHVFSHSFYISNFPNNLTLGQEWRSHNYGDCFQKWGSSLPGQLGAVAVFLSLLPEPPRVKPVIVHWKVCKGNTSFWFYAFVDYAAFHQTANTYKMNLKLVLSV